MVGRQGLSVKDIDGRPAQMARSQCGDQRRFLHQRAARHIHENGPRFHPGQGGGIDQPARLVRQGRTKCHDIRLRQQVGKADRLAAFRRGAAAGVAKYRHPETVNGDPCKGPSDAAHAKNAQHLAGDLAPVVGMGAPCGPPPRAQIAVDLRIAPQKRCCRPDHMLGHRQRIGTGHIGHQHPGGGRLGQRNHVQPRAMPDQRPQASLAPDDPRRDGRAHHDDLGPGAFVGNGLRHRRAGDAEGAKCTKCRRHLRVERVGREDHRAAPSTDAPVAGASSSSDQ